MFVFQKGSLFAHIKVSIIREGSRLSLSLINLISLDQESMEGDLLDSPTTFLIPSDILWAIDRSNSVGCGLASWAFLIIFFVGLATFLISRFAEDT